MPMTRCELARLPDDLEDTARGLELCGLEAVPDEVHAWMLTHLARIYGAIADILRLAVELDSPVPLRDAGFALDRLASGLPASPPQEVAAPSAN